MFCMLFAKLIVTACIKNRRAYTTSWWGTLNKRNTTLKKCNCLPKLEYLQLQEILSTKSYSKNDTINDNWTQCCLSTEFIRIVEMYGVLIWNLPQENVKLKFFKQDRSEQRYYFHNSRWHLEHFEKKISTCVKSGVLQIYTIFYYLFNFTVCQVLFLYFK